LEAALALLASGGSAQPAPQPRPPQAAALPTASQGLLSALLGLPGCQASSPTRQPSVPQPAAPSLCLQPVAAAPAAAGAAGAAGLKTDEELLCLLEAVAGRPQTLLPPGMAAAAPPGAGSNELASLLSALAGPPRPGPF
jgi:hypothetical protein